MFKIVNGIEIPLNEDEILEFEKREAEHAQKIEYFLSIAYQGRRREEYPSVDELVVALIEREEGRPEALNALMLRRQQIKNKHPKPA